MSDAGRIDRVAARVLVVDRDGAVLLLRGGDPHRPEAGTWWFTPGGGVDDGESVVIERHGRPVATLVRAQTQRVSPLGAMRGQFTMAKGWERALTDEEADIALEQKKRKQAEEESRTLFKLAA